MTQFAHFLNRIRTQTEKGQLSLTDKNILQSRVLTADYSQEIDDCLHIFSTNNDVDSHNIKMLNKLPHPLVTLTAVDYYTVQGKTYRRKDPVDLKSSKEKSFLVNKILIRLNARVMLTSNLNVEDGLVNGVMGTIKCILPEDNSTLPSAIAILFDHNSIGNNTKRSQSNLNTNYANCVFVKPSIDSFKFKTMSIQRHQYPLKLCWAVTIHKVQGKTVDRAVVSLKRIFKEGMAYVALSRVTKLEGLHLLNLDPNAIYTNSQIEASLSLLPNASQLDSCFTSFQQNFGRHCIKIASLNVEGLLPNVNGLLNHFVLKQMDIILLQESWLDSVETQLHKTFFPLHSFFHIPRCASYTGDSDVTSQLRTKSRGGVAALVHQDFKFQILDTSFIDAETLAFTVFNKSGCINFINLYRPPNINVKYFNDQIELLLQTVDNNACVIAGDFNINLMLNKEYEQLYNTYDFKQIINCATTDKNTLIDHIYIKQIPIYESFVCPVSFSHHNAPCLIIPC